MRRLLALTVLILAVFIALPVVLIYYHVPNVPFQINEWQYFIFALFLFPVVVSFIGVLVLSTHPHAFRIRRRELSSEPVSHEDDELHHYAIGYVIGVLQDFSQGRMTKPSLYGPELQRGLRQELQQLQIYFDRGFSFHFDFHHSEKYQAYTRHIINENDHVVEVDGIFSFYFERAGVKRSTPHLYDTSQPLIRVPGLARLRIQKNEQHQALVLVGFSENIRGIELGLPTQ